MFWRGQITVDVLAWVVCFTITNHVIFWRRLLCPTKTYSLIYKQEFSKVTSHGLKRDIKATKPKRYVNLSSKSCQKLTWQITTMEKPVSFGEIDHIHNNRHVGFDIIMQISHVVCQGANNKLMLFLRKSAGLNSEVSAPKSHLRAKMWYNDFIIKVSLK